MRYQRVLIATDLSENARQAARLGARFAASGGQVRVLHVVHQPEPPVYLVDRIKPRYDELASARRAGVRDAIDAWSSRAQLPPHETVVREGTPSREIEKEARDFGADLVVVGAKGRGRLAEALLGSTARSVLHRLPCDLLVVHETQAEIQMPLKRIVVATDFYEPSKAAARTAAGLAAQSGAQLVALHVIDNDLWTASAYGAPGLERSPVDRAWLEKNVGEMMAEFNRETMGGQARPVLRHGRAGPETARAADEERADLVVVGTHGAGPIERALIGSVAEDIVQRAKAAVLVVRAER